MTVMKFGGGCLVDVVSFRRVAAVVAAAGEPPLLVVSALFGTTDQLVAGIASARRDEASIPGFLERLRGRHLALLAELAPQDDVAVAEIDARLAALEKLLRGIAYTAEVTPWTKAQAVVCGERLAAFLLAAALQAAGVPAQALETDRIGLLTDDRAEGASADLEASRPGLAAAVAPLLQRGIVPVVTGFFGLTSSGRVATFGRNGSDYSAAVLARVLGATRLEIWKDVDGFMSADPKVVASARPVGRLSWREAAELSYFGARILHPLTTEPLRGAGVDVYVRNLLQPERPGTGIGDDGGETTMCVKSVTLNRQIALLRVHGAGVGFRPGVIGAIGDRMAAQGINILSVITAQTCINLLLERGDGERAKAALSSLNGVVGRVELERDRALLGGGRGLAPSRRRAGAGLLGRGRSTGQRRDGRRRRLRGGLLSGRGRSGRRTGPGRRAPRVFRESVYTSV